MHFATKCLQTMLRCIRLISRKAALSHHCHQTSGVNNTPGEADSCKVVISLRNPWVFMTTPQLIKVLPGLDFAYIVFGIGVGIFSQIYRYIRVSNRAQRQQTKWIVFGVTAAVGIFIGLVIISSRSPSGDNYNFLGEVIGNIVFSGVVLLIPLSIGFSILRYRLYDIDFLINRTLVYAILTALLAIIYFSLVFVFDSRKVTVC
jgi:hypothetical protein